MIAAVTTNAGVPLSAQLEADEDCSGGRDKGDAVGHSMHSEVPAEHEGCV